MVYLCGCRDANKDQLFVSREFTETGIDFQNNLPEEVDLAFVLVPVAPYALEDSRAIIKGVRSNADIGFRGRDDISLEIGEFRHHDSGIQRNQTQDRKPVAEDQ